MDVFLDNFFQVYVREKEEEFLDLYKGNMSINQYAACFVQLSHFTHILVGTKSWKARKFLKGLKVDTFYHIAILKSNSYVVPLEHAQLAENLNPA